MFLAYTPWNKLYLRSISSINQSKATSAFLGSVIAFGISKCGKSLNTVNSTFFGSTIISRKSSGLVLYIKLKTSELRHTLLPLPVEPATKRCGIFARLQSFTLPSISLPKAKVRGAFAIWKLSDSIISFNPTVSIVSFGTSTPTALLPLIGASILTSPRAARAIAMSDDWAWIFFTEIPVGICSSYLVTAAPRLTASTFAGTLKSSSSLSKISIFS